VRAHDRPKGQPHQDKSLVGECLSKRLSD
jgi:hypothetical protein